MLVGLGRWLRIAGYGTAIAETQGVNNQEIKVVYGARSETGEPSAVRAVLLRIGRTLGAWSDRAAQRRALLELTDQHLADIGIDRQTARREAAKPFWQA